MIYTVTLNPAVDYLLYLPEMRIGEIQRSDREIFDFSGKGINVSKVLTELGVETTALGFLAGFTGRAISEALAEDGVRQDFCFLPSGNTRVNVKLRHGRETDINGQGPDIPEASIGALLWKLRGLTDKDILVLAGSCPKRLRRTIYAEILEKVAPTGVTTVVDADGELLRYALPMRPFLVKPNREELSGILGKPLDSDGAVLEGARKLMEYGARNVLVSLGGDGAILCAESGEGYRIGAVSGTCVNSIGAGDSMIAGFLAGYLSGGGDFEAALRLGSAAGAASAFSEGLGTRLEIEALLRRVPAPVRI